MKYLRGFLTGVKVYRVIAAIALGVVVILFLACSITLMSFNSVFTESYIKKLNAQGNDLTRGQILGSVLYYLIILMASFPLVLFIFLLCNEIIVGGSPFSSSCVKKMRIVGIYYISLAVFGMLLSLIFMYAFKNNFIIDYIDLLFGGVYIVGSFAADYGIGLQSDCLPLPSEKVVIEAFQGEKPVLAKSEDKTTGKGTEQKAITEEKKSLPLPILPSRKNNMQTSFFTFEDAIQPCEEVFIVESTNYSLKIEVKATGVASVKTTYSSGEVISSFEGLSAGAIKIALPYAGEYRVQAFVTNGSGKVKVTLEKEEM